MRPPLIPLPPPLPPFPVFVRMVAILLLLKSGRLCLWLANVGVSLIERACRL